MLGNKMFVPRSIVFSLIFAAFFICPSVNTVRGEVTLSPSSASCASSEVLRADGTSPLPVPQPWFMTGV